jgi:hypothetical protein
VTSLPGTNTENAPLIGCNKLESLEINADTFAEPMDPYCSGLDLFFGYEDIDNYGTVIGSAPNTITNVVINGGVNIKGYSFYNEKITNVILADSIKKIRQM